MVLYVFVKLSTNFSVVEEEIPNFKKFKITMSFAFCVLIHLLKCFEPLFC